MIHFDIRTIYIRFVGTHEAYDRMDCKTIYNHAAMIDKIRTEGQYEEVMRLIEGFIGKATESGGFKALSKSENAELQQLSALAEQYENEVLRIMPLPLSVPELVRQKTRELNLTQARLSELMGIEAAKLSLILNGRRKPDIPFLKAAHQKLGLDGNLMLEYV